MFKHLRYDLPAGLVVFLVALPLCLGVALASGAPLISGIISGIIGGILVGFLSESHISVSGPAAGLTAVVLAAITDLGSFEVFTLSVLIAGFIQFIAGFARAGIIANYIPSNIIKGLLAAIGIILILKQIPHAVGYDSDAEGDFEFIQTDGHNTFTEYLYVLNYFKWSAVVISALSFLLFWLLEKPFMTKLKAVPASLIVVLAGVLMNELFKLLIPGLYIESSHRVNLPEIHSVHDIIRFPDFSGFANRDMWIAAVTIAIVATIESLLNLEAVENLDPHKRVASPDRELIAQGVGNMASGLFGGIPVTSVIVRSSVNIQSGGLTKLSSIFHGVLLLVSLLFLSPVLAMIPLASLAVILILTGYKLAKKEVFIDMFRKGINQFVPFLVTVLAIVLTDLLIGIMIGSLVSVFYILKSNYLNPFTLSIEQLSIGETTRLELSNQVSFFSKQRLKRALWSLKPGSKVIIDATYANYIDHDVLELLHDFKETVAVENNILVNLVGVKDKTGMINHITFSNVLDKETQIKMTPDEILALLQAGNERFVEGRSTEKYIQQQVNQTSTQQNPIAAIVSCIDSRTSPELIFDVGLGDVVSIRIAGNVINREIIESLELSCKELGTRLIVILGHSNCGAVAYSIHNWQQNAVTPNISGKINRAVESCGIPRTEITNSRVTFDKVIIRNTQDSLQDVLQESAYLRQQASSGHIKIVSAFYDTANGQVKFD